MEEKKLIKYWMSFMLDRNYQAKGAIEKISSMPQVHGVLPNKSKKKVYVFCVSYMSP